MNRDEFMQQLARLLSDMSESERMEAIRYYNDYFDEAGPENESKVIQELGSPGKVAAIIKADLKENSSSEEIRKKEQQETDAERNKNQYQQETDAEWNKNQYQQETSTGWTNTDTHNHTESGWNNKGYQQQNHMERTRSTLRPRKGVGSWALIIILLVFISPVILGIGGGIFGVLAGIFAAIFGIFIGIFSAGVGMVGGGIALVFKGIIRVFTVPASGFVSIGGGMICIALGIFFLIFSFWLAFRLLPRFFRAVVNFISRLFHRRKGAAIQ